MFGETSSESPRMPSPWEALATPASSHQPSPRASSANLAVPSTPLRNVVDVSPPATTESMKYLDDAVRADGADLLSPNAGEAFPKLVPEIEEGNVEYKLKLIAPTPARFTRLVTQLKYRLLEGGGQALYEIGVSDSGELVGLSRADLEASLDTLDKMAGELGATVVVLKEIELPPGGVHLQAQRGGKRIVVADGKVEVLEVNVDKSGVKDVVVGVEHGSKNGAAVVRMGRKKKDKDARRKRRAAALLVGEIATADLESKIDGDTGLSSASGDPSSPLADDDDSGLDLAATVTLKKPDDLQQPSDMRRTSPIPMPIIKNYPYGRQPFAMARGRLSSSASASAHEACSTSPAARESSAAESSTDYTVDDFVYIPSSSSERSPKGNASKARKSSDDEEGAVEDEGEDAFGFGMDLEIDSFAKSMDSFTAKGLGPSPHVKPSPSRPLHYTPTSGAPLDRTSDSDPSHLKRLKVPNQKKKPIILPHTAGENGIVGGGQKTANAAEKAVQRRLKRDARRDERRRKVNGLGLEDDAQAGGSTPGDGEGEEAPAISVNGGRHSKRRKSPSASPKEEKRVVDDTEPKIIAEALVVRKLALEEAFLDYHGFALIDPTAELSIAEGGEDDVESGEEEDE